MLTLEMDRGDWERLADFVRRANVVRTSMSKADDDGKQQLSMRDAAITEFLGCDVPPEFWLKLGSMLSEKLRQGGNADRSESGK